MWYRETKTIPTLMTTFTESLERIQRDNNTASTLANESFERRNKALLDSFGELTREERTICQRWHEENRELDRQILHETTENRHLIKNLANVAGLRKAEAEAEERARRPQGDRDAG